VISRILEIDKFGPFDSFRWNANISEFRKYNVFYGWNYSGKTTLSRVFGNLEVGQSQSMPEISQFYGIIVAMFFDDHNPPPFHARYGGEKVAIEVDSLRIMEGHISPRALRLVIEWAAQHKDELFNNWELVKNNQTPNNIEPLK